MAKIERFEDIDAWKEARVLTKQVYQATRKRGFRNDFSMVDQIRRASVSIMSNIAEGFNRGGDKEFVQFLAVAKGSTGEVQSLLYAAVDQEYLAEDEFHDLMQRADLVAKLTGGFLSYLKKSPFRGSKFN
jgi:four helix bundle protein